MQQIIYFFLRNKNFLLFLFLFTISIGLTLQTHSYHSNRFLSSANFFSGGIYSIQSGITGYFDLKKHNTNLVEENKRLRSQIESMKAVAPGAIIDTSAYYSDYIFRNARVIHNSYAKTKNQLTINRGRNDSLKIDMGVITSNGIVGKITHVSSNYASVQSVLNIKSQTNAKLKSTNHFGTLKWDTQNPSIVKLEDIPRLAPVALGDTVVTGGSSTIFPEGVLVGFVKQFVLNEGDDYYDLSVELFNDMTNLSHVYIIENKEKEEIKTLEVEVEDAEQ